MYSTIYNSYKTVILINKSKQSEIYACPFPALIEPSNVDFVKHLFGRIDTLSNEVSSLMKAYNVQNISNSSKERNNAVSSESFASNSEVQTRELKKGETSDRIRKAKKKRKSSKVNNKINKRPINDSGGIKYRK